MNDAEYLAQAGIKDTGDSSSPETAAAQPETSSTPESSAQPSQSGQQPPTQAEIEMFELMGNKFPVNTEFKITHGGQVQKVPYSNLINTYRTASHLQEKWNEAKKQLDGFKDYDKFKGFHEKYGAIQEWSETNPQEWQRLWDLYQNKDLHLMGQRQAEGAVSGTPGAGGSLPPEVVQMISELRNQVSELGKFKSSFEQEQQKKAEEADVQHVKSEISSFEKEFPELNLKEQDPDGVPLWAKIVQFGTQNGFLEFTPAAHMYLKSRIADTYQTRARNEAMKSTKEQYAQGIVKRSPVPSQAQATGGRSLDAKKMSYSELAEAAKSGAFSQAG